MTKVVCIKDCLLTKCILVNGKFNGSFCFPGKRSDFLIRKNTLWYFSCLDYMVLSSFDADVIGVFNGVFEEHFVYLQEFRDKRIDEILE